jgi:hypothetical protein
MILGNQKLLFLFSFFEREGQKDCRSDLY